MIAALNAKQFSVGAVLYCPVFFFLGILLLSSSALTQRREMGKRLYRIGIDVGLNSVGLAAVEVDEAGTPLRILNAQSVIHDGGVDPQKNKEAITRKKQAGVARRTRRMRRRRKARLARLDNVLEQFGYPIVEPDSLTEPFEEWTVRGRLAKEYIENDDERLEDISIAIRHIARHRGWRNPYQRVETLLVDTPYSEQYNELKQRVEQYVGFSVGDDLTPAELVCEVLQHEYAESPRLRTTTRKENPKEGLLPTRLIQSDNANELRRIFAMQHVPESQSQELVKAIFASQTPKGSAEARVGDDPLDKTQKRALKASLAFQEYRIVNVITNLRIKEDGIERPLTVREKNTVFELLSSSVKDDITWGDVAHKLGLERSQIKGVGKQTQDGEDRVSSKPPRMDSIRAILSCSDTKLRKKLSNWWSIADCDAREAMIALLSNTVDIDKVQDDERYAKAIDFIDTLTDEELTKLDGINLPAGRAAYSAATLKSLKEQMLNTDDDLHEARKHLFNVDDNWRPPADDIGAPLGNPAVDRVLKIVNRYIVNCLKRWGTPSNVQIEHVRDGLSSVSTARKNKREHERTTDRRNAFRNDLKKQLRLDEQVEKVRESDLRRWEAVQRQNGRCLYCGETITFRACEMDHIVPRKGVGSTNTRTNFAAVCSECNRLKGNMPFAVWSRTGQARARGVEYSEVIQRVESFIFAEGSYNRAAQRNFKQEVIARLRQTELDDPIDNRSIESVAWMADELHRRIDWFFNHDAYLYPDVLPNTSVRVFRGRLTSDARKASHIEDQMHFIGGGGKTRLDRRHHAVDAAVIAMMRPGVAQILAERDSLRESQRLVGKLYPGEIPWQEYPGSDSPGYTLFQNWLDHMRKLLELLNDALDNNRIAVTQWSRLSLGNSVAHDDTVHKLLSVPLGSALNADIIRKASTPALYCALTRLPDYDEKTGLPENQERRIVVHGQCLNADDKVSFFSSSAAQIMVRGGSADIGSAIHHARIYRCWEYRSKNKKKIFYGMIRVFQADLVRYRNQDLFSASLAEQSISMRYADQNTAQAVLAGRAEYLGWLCVGDTIVVDFADNKLPGQLSQFCDFVKQISQDNSAAYSCWSVDGFYDANRLRLRPRFLSSEGIDSVANKLQIEIPDAVVKTLKKPGWLVAVNTLSEYHPICRRYNALGECRWNSHSGMPVSWRWQTPQSE